MYILNYFIKKENSKRKLKKFHTDFIPEIGKNSSPLILKHKEF